MQTAPATIKPMPFGSLTFCTLFVLSSSMQESYSSYSFCLRLKYPIIRSSSANAFAPTGCDVKAIGAGYCMTGDGAATGIGAGINTGPGAGAGAGAG